MQYGLFQNSFVLLSFKILESFYRMIVLVSKLISLTVNMYSNVNSTCSGMENRTLAFVFDACNEDMLTNKCEKRSFLLATQQSLGSAVNCTVQKDWRRSCARDKGKQEKF